MCFFLSVCVQTPCDRDPPPCAHFRRLRVCAPLCVWVGLLCCGFGRVRTREERVRVWDVFFETIDHIPRALVLCVPMFCSPYYVSTERTPEKNNQAVHPPPPFAPHCPLVPFRTNPALIVALAPSATISRHTPISFVARAHTSCEATPPAKRQFFGRGETQQKTPSLPSLSGFVFCGDEKANQNKDGALLRRTLCENYS